MGNKMKKILAMLMVVITVITGTLVFNIEAKAANEFEFEIVREGNTIKGVAVKEYNGDAKNITIPNRYGPFSVIAIKEGVFQGKDITSVTIPSSIKTIEKNAFKNCAQLNEVRFSEGLESIGESAFENCKELTSIKFPNSLKKVEMAAFRNCGKLQTVTIQHGLQNIGEEAFASCENLSDIELPESLKTIGKCSFYGTSKLLSISIPASVNVIGEEAFSYSGIQNLTLKEGLKEIKESAFAFCSMLEKVTIPQSVTNVADYAFYQCSAMTKAIIQSKDTYISWKASFGMLMDKGSGSDVESSAFVMECPENSQAYNYAKTHGFLREGEWILESGGKKKYKFTYAGYAKSTWVKIDGKFYYFDDNEYLASGWIKDGNAYRYCPADNDSAAVAGWIIYGGKWFLFDEKECHMQTGWVDYKGEKCYLDEEKGPWQGACVVGLKTINNVNYVFSSAGYMIKGWGKYNGHWYYTHKGDDGKWPVMTGWYTDEVGDKYYLKPTNGQMLTGWNKIEGNWYYFNKGGIMQTGFVISKDKNYYLEEKGPKQGQLVIGWKEMDGEWYYFDKEPKLDTEIGMMAIGWKPIGSKEYYFYGDGVMAKDVDIYYKGDPWHIDSNGVCTGKCEVDHR